jgi:hypothetical protein
MEGVVASTDDEEQIKWFDAMDALLVTASSLPLMWSRIGHATNFVVKLATQCRHPDAQWICSLFPVPDYDIVHTTWQDVMEAQGDDPRALSYLWATTLNPRLLERAAELGYAPAQAAFSSKRDVPAGSGFLWAERAAAQGDRRGMYLLAGRYMFGAGCKKDDVKAAALYQRAGELGDMKAVVRYGEVSFGELDWRRYRVWAAVFRRRFIFPEMLRGLRKLLPLFKAGLHGRILFEAAPDVRAAVCGGLMSYADDAKFEAIFSVYEACRARAREGVKWWSLAARRLPVVKDIRVKIAKILWEEAWGWNEKTEQTA